MKKRKARIWWEGHPDWVAYVGDNCSSKTDEEIAAHLQALTTKYPIDAHSIKLVRHRNHWQTVEPFNTSWRTSEMAQFVRDNWPGMNEPQLVAAIKQKLLDSLGLEVANQMLVTRGTVRKLRKEAGCIGEPTLPLPLEVTDQILKLRSQMSAEKIALELGVPAYRVRNFLKKRKLKLKHARVKWPKKAKDYVRENYKTKTNMELALELNKICPRGKRNGKWKNDQIAQQLLELKLSRTDEEIAAARKKNVELGLSVYGYDANRGYKNGAVTIRNEKRNNGSIVQVPYVKTKEGFRLKKHIVWEKHKGPIPEYHIIRCKDGNELNTRITNLELASVSEGMERWAESLHDDYVIMISSLKNPAYRKFLKSESGKNEVEFHKARLTLNRLIKKHESNAK
jgi:hypothetical protein